MNLIETVRSQFTLHERAKVGDWPLRRDALLKHLPRRPEQLTAANIVGLADYLSDVFQLPHLRHNRDQASVSGGGIVWTALVSYYFNLCLAGTDAIALSGKFLPGPIREALKVTHSSSAATKLNSDIDIVVLNIPNARGIEPSRRSALNQLSAIVDGHFGDTSAIVVQTKTNWNDSAQVPMLWNMIYKLARDGRVPENGVAVGSGGFHVRALAGFGYAFATVPTQSDLDCFKPNSTAVVRVRAMTCGAYWGRPSRQGIISSLREFFNTAYNRTQHHFPPPNRAGEGYANEVANKRGAVDLQAFDLIR